MKRILFALTGLLIVATSFAASSGIYAGGNAGWSSPASAPDANTYFPNVPALNTKNQNFSFSGMVGYNYALNQSWLVGLEGGYSDFGKTQYRSNGNTIAYFKNTAWQLFATATYLIDSSQWNAFGKLGAASENTTLNFSGATASTPGQSQTKWLPALALGAGYYLLNNLNLFGQYERVFGNSWNNQPANQPVSLNAFTLGVTYTLPL